MEDAPLHGDLDLYILEARNLPNKDLFTEHLRCCFTACSLSLPFRSKPPSPNHHHHHEARATKVITSDPYVTVVVAGATVARTQVISNDENPQWNQHFYLPLAHYTPHIEFCVKDNDVCGADIIGTASISAAEVAAAGELIEKWLQILDPSGNPLKYAPSLHVKLRFTTVGKNPIAGNPERLGVHGTYFPVRKGGMVTLYQDAHVKEMDLPEIQLDEGRVFRQGTCWEDMCHAILEAHRLIYIVGWSIYDKVRLVREQTRPLPAGGELTLGELLKYKSEEGVRVCLLIWDDRTSNDKLLIRTVTL